jgi:hypothetical protein
MERHFRENPVATAPGSVRDLNLKLLCSYFAGAILGMLLMSCTAATSGTSNSPNPTPSPNQKDKYEVSTSVEELGKLVNLAERPSSVVWRRRTLGNAGSSIPGPTDWLLEAVLTFDQQQTERLIEEAKTSTVKPGDTGSFENIDWVPAEIRQHFHQDAGSAKYKPTGEVYSPSTFIKSPLTQGYLVHLGDSPNFFLVLHTQ